MKAAFAKSHLLCFLLGLAAPLRAQDETQALAAAIVRSLAPSADDPDATARDLVTTALAHPRSPGSSFLIEETGYLVRWLQDPKSLRELLAADGAGRQHGLLAHTCADLRWTLDRAILGLDRAGPLPPANYATALLVVGPFGDSGDHFVGVPFAPELRFPALGSELPGRNTVARVRVVERQRESRQFRLGSVGRPRPGCYYGLHRIAAAADTDAFLVLVHEGDHQVFVDGAEVLRVQEQLGTEPQYHCLGLHLPAGEHQVLVKTCSINNDQLSLRWLDTEGYPPAGLREVAATDPLAAVQKPATPNQQTFLSPREVFGRAARAEAAPAAVRIAALHRAQRDGDHDLAVDLAELLRKDPPRDPNDALAFARLLRAVHLPDELRKAEARALEERASADLPAAHHAARVAKASLLDEQDQREQALRLLAEPPATGPETFSRRLGLVRKLRFDAEVVPLLQAWAAACPRDPRPLAALANEGGAARDARAVLGWQRQALALRPDQPGLVQQTFRTALDLGEYEIAAELLRDIAPSYGGAAAVPHLRAELDLAQQRGLPTVPDLMHAIAAHPDVDPDTLLYLATSWAKNGDTTQTVACLRRSLELDADQPSVRAWLAQLGETPPDDDEFARFRVDVDAIRTAFQPGERERGASTTLLFDQRIVALRPDGSWLAESHELRRINDLAGVEQNRSASSLSGANEVLLVRTIGVDGRSYVPHRVEGEYAMQRLEPGAFVEWRYRERGGAPDAAPLSTPAFYFGSSDEPCQRSELVLILPKSGRGELRTHDFDAPTATHDLPDGRKALVFTRTDIKALPQEQHLPPLPELLPFVEFGEDTPPFATLREHNTQFGVRTRPLAPIAAAAAQLFSGLADDRARLAAAWDWCQKTIEKGPADSALDVLLRKKGSRFLLTVALLRAARIDVVPVACAEVRPELGPGVESLFANTEHISVPGALVTLANGDRVYLFVDTPRYWPLGAVPAGRAGSRAYVLRGDDIEAVTLPGSADAVQTVHVRGEATVAGNDVQLQATAEIGDVQGFDLADRTRELKENVQKLAARQIATQLFPDWRVESAQIVSTTGPFRLEAKLTRTGVQARGDGFVVPLPMPPGRYVTTYGDRNERTLPYHLAADTTSDWQIDFAPGPELQFVSIPEPVSIQQAMMAYDLVCTRHGDRLRFSRNVRLQAGTLPAAKFAGWMRALGNADRADQCSIELARS
jgi:tetratricopeptide (TPR) repeat protein